MYFVSGVVRLVRAALHYLRWRARFGAFGWRSTLVRPALLTGLRRVHLGRRVEIRGGARIETVDPEAQIEIGDRTSIHLHFHVGAAERVRIGERVLIAGNVYVTDHDHELGEPGTPRGSRPALQAAPTTIGDDCWLGEGCKILKGVDLGQGCVVGAGAVVTRSFPPYTLLVGVPARAIRRFDSAVGEWVGVRDGRP